MGHSAGGVFMQIVIDHGFGAAGVAINSAPTEGVPVVPLAQVKATFPVLKNPANRHRPSATRSSSGSTRSPTPSPRRSPPALRALPRPGVGPSCGTACSRTSSPATRSTWVDYKNDYRAPLLFISGSEDHLMPPAIQKSNAKHYKSNTITERKEYEGKAHLMPSQEGWEEIADYALDWAVEQRRARQTPGRCRRPA